MKRIALTVFIFCSLNCSSQNSFFNLYPNTLGSVINRIIPIHDNGLVGVCEGGSIVKFDSAMQNSWLKNIEVPGYILSFEDILELNNHDFMIVGQFFKSNVIDTYFLMRTDSLGNLVYMKIGTDSLSFPEPRFAGKTSDGGFIFSGYLYIDSLQKRFGFTAKVDSTGNSVWTTAYLPDTGAFYPGNINVLGSRVTSDGYTVVSGFYSYYSLGNNYFSIIKLDSSGTPVWFKHSSFWNINDVANPPIERNGNYYVQTFEELPNEVVVRPHLRKISALTGDLEWHIKYSDIINTGSPDQLSIIKTHDDRMVMMGRNDTLAYGFSMSVEFDSVGNISRHELYTTYFSNTSVQFQFINIIETNTNTLVATGYKEDMSTNEWGFVLASLDTSFQTTCHSFYQNINPLVHVSDTLISSGSAFSVSTSLLDITSLVQTTTTVLSKIDFCNFVSVEENKFENSFSISPNPTTGKLRTENEELKIESISIFNLFGEKVIGVEAQTEINISVLASGIYILQATAGEKIWRAKVIKE